MILVTGGTGFIGSHLVERLTSQEKSGKGKSVRLFVRKKNFSEKPAVSGIARGDLVSGEGISAALEGVDTVLHLAGVTKALSTADYYAGNVRAAVNLAKAVAGCSHPVRFVHVSSLAAIGPAADFTPLAENAPPHPLTSYGRSKLEGEQRVREILPHAIVVRPPVVYGPRDTDVFQLLKSISRGMVLQIAGGERYFSAIYADDLAAGILAAAGARGAEGHEYFLAHPKPVSWTDFAATAARIMNRSPRVVNIPVGMAYSLGRAAEYWAAFTRKPGIISRDKITEAQCRYWICDTARAAKEIGFTAPTGIEDGLARTLSWYRESGWLKF